MEFNYYEILGINQNANDAEIKAAYKELAKKYHPDKHGNNKSYEEHFKKINAAYQTLSNKQKRNNYDYKLRYRSTSVHTSSPSNQATSAQNARARRPQPRYYQKGNSYSAPNKDSDKKLLRKVYATTFISLIILVIAGIYFYNYMNHYSAQKEYNEGLQMEKENKYFRALESYSAAIAYDDRFGPAHIKRGMLRMMLWDDYKGAYYDFSNAIKYNEKPDANLYFQRAKCQIGLNNKEDALTDLNEAEKINPTVDSIFFYRGELYCYVFHNYEKAIEEYKLALSKNQGMTEAWFGKGISEQELGRHQAAIQDISQAIRLNDEDGRYYYYRAYSHLGLKDTALACSDWNVAINKEFYDAQAPLEKVCK